jgi:hypothetical protein
MGYHKEQIEKGVIGEFSKIREEYEELRDAVNQDNTILSLCELSDLIGAIECYIEQWNLKIEDLKKFSNKTKEAFKEGKR